REARRHRRAAASVRTDVSPTSPARNPCSRGARTFDRRSRRSILYGWDNRGVTASPDRAMELWREGTSRLLQGDLDEAVALFTLSLEEEPSAEAYTFRGWAFSFQGRRDDAIEECRKAIATDPGFGNPYNDIGCYLVEMGRGEEAIPWFEQAKRASRYDPRHFPSLNLGRLHP